METEELEKREDLLAKLHSIDSFVYLVDLYTEMCYEVTTMNAQGIGTFWSAYDDYHIYCLKNVEPDYLNGIKQKLADGILQYSDVENTSLGQLLTILDLRESAISALSGLIDIAAGTDSCLYCYFDDYYSKLEFCSSKEQFAAVLGKEFCVVDTEWKDMDTYELEQFWDLYRSEEDKIPCCYLGEDDLCQLT